MAVDGDVGVREGTTGDVEDEDTTGNATSPVNADAEDGLADCTTNVLTVDADVDEFDS